MLIYSNILYSTMRETLNKSLTGTNPYFISDTSAHTGLSGYAIKAIEDTVIAAYGPLPKGSTIIGETILAGDTWYLSCANITLTSGACIVYNHNTIAG